MAKIAICMADGCEEIEALTVVDVIGKEAVEQSQKLADSIGIPLRVRVYEE